MPSIINATTTGGVVVSGDNSGSLQLASNNGTTAVTISTAQKVGIGTTPSGSYILEVNGNPNFNSVGGVYLTCGTYDAIKNPSGSVLAFGGVTASQWDTTALYTSGSEWMRILSNGGILLGTTTAEGATGISFSNASDSATYGKSMYMNSPYNGTRNAITFAYNSSGVGAIVTGTSSTSYNTSSDYRLKQDIAPMTGALAKVAQLKPVTYKWKLDGSDGQGFIAHELAEVVPDCVTGEKDAVETYTDGDGNEQTRIKPQGVDTSFLVATLTAALQELNAKVEAQAVRIAELEGA